MKCADGRRYQGLFLLGNRLAQPFALTSESLVYLLGALEVLRRPLVRRALAILARLSHAGFLVNLCLDALRDRLGVVRQVYGRLERIEDLALPLLQLSCVVLFLGFRVPCRIGLRVRSDCMLRGELLLSRTLTFEPSSQPPLLNTLSLLWPFGLRIRIRSNHEVLPVQEVLWRPLSVTV